MSIAFLLFRRATKAETIVVRLGDSTVKLNSNDLSDVAKFLEIVGIQIGSGPVDVSIDGVPIYSHGSGPPSDELPTQINLTAERDPAALDPAAPEKLMARDPALRQELTKRMSEVEAAEKRQESEGGGQ